MMLLTSNINWRLGALLAGIICMLCHTAASAEVSKAEEEVWEAWKSHVAEFHDGDAEFLSRPDRFRAFRKSFHLVKSHNERYATGKETFTMKLNYRAAFVPDDNPQPPPPPAPQKDMQSSSLRFDGRARMLVLQKPRCGPVYKKRKIVAIRMCPKRQCCSATGRCGRGKRFCGKGCQPQFGRCKNSTFFSTGIPPRKDPEPEGVFIRSIVQETKFRYASISPDCLPPCVDWRPLFDKIRNQYYCGNCWAVSSIAAIEATIRVATGKFANLSVQQPMDCSTGTDIPSAGCQGGWPEKNLEWITQQKGMAFEETYPTVYSNQTCQSFQTVDVNVTSYGYVPSMSVTALKAAVSVQPIVVYIKAEDSLEHYSGGIYSPSDCGKDVNHAVLLVGYCIDWGTGKEYWIIQNSWGEAWGEGGYVRVAMTEEGSEGICGMLVREPVFPVVRGPSWNPCFFRPCGGGTCKPSSAMPGGFTCTSCPHGFYVQKNSDGTQTCAANPCEDTEINVCGTGDCKFDPNAIYGYTCQCEEGTVLGAFTSGAPTCSLTSDGVRSYALKSRDTCKALAERNSFTLEAFKGINPNLDCSNLIPGQLVSLGNYVPNPRCTLIYTAGEGETCESIREKFDLSLDKLDGLNPGIDCQSALPTYWQLCVKGERPKTSFGVVPRCGKQVRTVPGDNCFRVLAKSGNKVTVDVFITLNSHIPGVFSRCKPTTNGVNFAPRTTVCVQRQTIALSSGPKCKRSIQSAIGDTCLTISIREQLSVADLEEKNPGLNCDILQIGRILCVA